MRSLIGLFGFVCGAIIVAIVARYGFKSADNELDGMISAFLFGTIAAGGLGGHAVAARIWKSSRTWALVVGAVSSLALLVNLTNSLGYIAGRGDTKQAETVKHLDAIREGKAELARLNRAREAVPAFVPTTAAAVQAAERAVAAAEATRMAECEKRGAFCRQRETDEAARRSELVAALGNLATTDRVAKLDAEIEAVRSRLAAAPTVASENPQAAALVKLFALPDADLNRAAVYQQFAAAVVVELLVVAAFVAFELMGNEGQRPTRGGERDVARREAIDVTPEPPAAPAVSDTPPSRSKPRLIASEPKPLGGPAEILPAILSPAKGHRVSFADVYLAYEAACAAAGRRTLKPEKLVEPLREFCEARSIKIGKDGTLLGARIVRLAVATAV